MKPLLLFLVLSALVILSGCQKTTDTATTQTTGTTALATTASTATTTATTAATIATTTTTATTATTVFNPPKPHGDDSWNLVFDDEFNGNTLDMSKWSYNYPWGPTHNHNAYMSPDNVTVANGLLTIKATNERDPQAPYSVVQGGQTYVLNYTSGAINTKDKFDFTYGYVEGRFLLPKTQGFWPAFWLLPQSGAWPPEVDIFEFLSHAPTTINLGYHYGSDWQHEASFYHSYTEPDLTAGFHTFAFEWTPYSMSWFLDGLKFADTYFDTANINQAKNMYIIINLAVGGWEPLPNSTTSWPGLYQCDWVRVWQKNA